MTFATAALVCVATPASVSGDQGEPVVTACAGPNGQLRLVESASECRPSEKPLQWSVRGPVGPQGERGPQGEQGPQGLQGSQGPAGPGFSGPQYYTIGNGDLQGVGSSLNLQSFAPGAGVSPGGTYIQAGTARVLAGVHLPQGAVVSQLRMGGIDVSSTTDLRLELVEQNVDTGASTVLASLASTGAAGSFVLSSGVSPIVIDNAAKHYFVQVHVVNAGTTQLAPNWGGQTMQVFGIVITYSLQ